MAAGIPKNHRTQTFPKGEGFCCLLHIYSPKKRKQLDFPGEGFSPSGISFGHSKRMRADRRETRREQSLRRRSADEEARYAEATP